MYETALGVCLAFYGIAALVSSFNERYKFIPNKLNVFWYMDKVVDRILKH